MKMSDVLQRFYVQIFYEGRAEIFEWAKGRQFVDTFELGGLEGMKAAKLIFDFVNLRDTFRLSDAFQRLFNKRTESRTNFLIDLWKYARLKNLVNKGVVQCNVELREALKMESFRFEDLNPDDYLLPLDPLVVDVKIGEREIFDVEMEIDDLVDFPVLYSDKKIHSLKRKVDELSEMVKNCKERVGVLEKFAECPEEYIDGNVVADERNFFYDILVQDLVFKLLNANK